MGSVPGFEVGEIAIHIAGNSNLLEYNGISHVAVFTNVWGMNSILRNNYFHDLKPTARYCPQFTKGTAVNSEVTNEACVRFVVFSVDGIPTAQVSQSPYSFVWDAGEKKPGSYTIEAMAYDLFPDKAPRIGRQFQGQKS